MKANSFLALSCISLISLSLLLSSCNHSSQSPTSRVSKPNSTSSETQADAQASPSTGSGSPTSVGSEGATGITSSGKTTVTTKSGNKITIHTNPVNKPHADSSGKVSGTSLLYSVNVLDAGLSNDGKTDCSKPLQEAINLLDKNVSFYFPAGTYLFNSPIHLKQGANLIGTPSSQGIGGSVIKAGKSMDYVFSNETGSFCRDLLISNFTCDGNSANVRVQNFFYLESVLGSSLSNIAFQNISGNGITTVRVSANPYDWTSHYYDFTFKNVSGYAIDTTQTDSWYSNISINGGKGIIDRVNGGSSYRNVTISNSTGAGLTVGTPGRSEVGDTCIVNCTFKNNASYGVMLNASTRYDKQVAISECDFSGNHSADVYMTNIAEATVSNCNLRSATPVVTNNTTSGCVFMENSVSASSFNLKGTNNVDHKNVMHTSSFSSGRGTQPSANTSSTLYKKLTQNKVVSIYDYGAVGGSTSNISAALQKAVNAVSGGGTVVIPAGEYALASPVTIPSNVTIYGNNVKLYPLAGVGTMLNLKNASNVVLTGLILDNSRGVSIDQFVSLDNCKNCLFTNFHIWHGQKTSKASVFINSNCSGIEIEHCVFIFHPENSGTNTVIHCAGSNTRIHESYFSHGTVGVHFVGGQNNHIYSSHFDWFTTSAILFTNSGTSPMNHTISNCYFDINNVVAKFAFTTKYNSGVSFNCNTIRADGHVMVGGKLPPVINVTNGTHITFKGNTFQYPGAFALYGSTTGLTIVGNASQGSMIAAGSTTGSVFTANGIRS